MPSGGRRNGAGRPNGACDRLPRRGSKLENEIERLKYATGQIHPFAGDSLALMQAVYRGEYIATREQLYAANAAMGREHPPAALVDGRSVEAIREEVRQEFLRPDGVDPLEKIMDEISRLRQAKRESTGLHARVRKWIATDLAEIIRGNEPDEDEDEAINAALSALDNAKLDEIAHHVQELWPQYCSPKRYISKLLPPPQPEVPVRKHQGPLIDREPTGR
jgi:hypothetical protein